MLKTFHLASTLLWREWRKGEWLIVFLALFIAIASTTSIHFYVDRLTRGLDQQGAAFLGGDLVVTSASPIPHAWIAKAKDVGLETAEVWSYPSVISTKDKLQMVNLQAVSSHYPLLNKKSKPLARQEVRLEPRLLSLLHIHTNDSITIGRANFTVKDILTSDSDALTTGWAIAPRVMMRLDDVAVTHTVIAGSRVDYRLLLVGDKKQLQAYVAWLNPLLNTNQRLLDIHNQQFALNSTLEKASNYLQLVLLVCLLISGVAIALSIQQYITKHYAHVALWRCFGASQQQIFYIMLYQLCLVALLAGVLGVGIGYIAQTVFANLFASFFQFTLPASSIFPALLGLLTSLCLLFTFAYPLINRLPLTSPLYLWRHELPKLSLFSYACFLSVLLAIGIFIYWSMSFSLLSLYFIYAVIVCVVFLYAFSLMVLALLRLILIHTEGSLRRGLSQLTQYADSVSWQFVGLSLILIAFIVLALVRTHLIQHWQQSLPKNTPNYFAINIAPTDLQPLRAFFKAQEVPIENIYPMVKGRLVALNERPILSMVSEQAKNNNALHRELNLSWMQTFPSDNKIVQGLAWTKSDNNKPLVSVEKNVADDLQLKLGDKLTFQTGDKTITATIVNIRTLDWSSFHPNFFMIFPPGILDDFPTTYITSFHLSANQTLVLNKLVQDFPNVTIIDVANLLYQIQDLISKITLAMQYLFLFTLAAGILIFIASLQASMGERRKAYYLLRILGAGKSYLRKSTIIEFTTLFFIIITTSIFLAYLLMHYLDAYIFAI